MMPEDRVNMAVEMSSVVAANLSINTGRDPKISREEMFRKPEKGFPSGRMIP